MLTQTTQIEIELKKLISIEVERLKEQLAVNMFEDVASFRFIMGQIAALRSMDDLISEARQRSDQRSR